MVSSYALDDGARLLLFDPLAVPEEILDVAADREPVVVLTAPWHERDAQSLVERFGAPVFTPPPDTADGLVRKSASLRSRSRRAGTVPMSRGYWQRAAGRPTCTDGVTGFRSASRRSPDDRTTT